MHIVATIGSIVVRGVYPQTQSGPLPLDPTGGLPRPQYFTTPPGTPDSTEAMAGGSETHSVGTISSTPDVTTVDEIDQGIAPPTSYLTLSSFYPSEISNNIMLILHLVPSASTILLIASFSFPPKAISPKGHLPEFDWLDN